MKSSRNTDARLNHCCHPEQCLKVEKGLEEFYVRGWLSADYFQNVSLANDLATLGKAGMLGLGPIILILLAFSKPRI
jgi:hypothetical protein